MRFEPPRLVAGQRPAAGAYDADIVILCLGRLEETMTAIASALAQKGGAFHVSVLDQGSEPEVIQTLAARFGKMRHFALYAAAANRGVAAGRNLLAAFGHGRVIVGLDNDACFADEWVAAGALRRFRDMPELGAIGFAILRADGQGPDLTSWGYPKALLRQYRARFAATTFVGAGHAIRRAAWEAVGGYDESFFFTWEEYDFCLAAIARGWRIAYEGRLAVIHTPAAEGRFRWQGARMMFFIRNRVIIGRKWGQGWPWRLGWRGTGWWRRGMGAWVLPGRGCCRAGGRSWPRPGECPDQCGITYWPMRPGSAEHC